MQASSRLKPLGRDRYCNRYWYFDANHGSVSFDAITHIQSDGTESKPDPEIPYDYSCGVLFVEEIGLQPVQGLHEPNSDLRIGNWDGKWGYFSSLEEVYLCAYD